MNDQKDFLYKYRAIDEKNIDWSSRIFTHNEVYFADAPQFNDPFDCKFDYSFDANNRELNTYLHRNLERQHPDWNRQQRREWIAKHSRTLKRRDPKFEQRLRQDTERTLSEIGIYSLSRVPDDILMWSHYANRHTGFCLKFIDDQKDWFIARAQAISYSEIFPIVNPIKDNDLERLKTSLLTKAKHWEYEKEWRIIDYEKGPGIKHIPPHLLVGVIFGCRMTEKHQGRIRGWCENRETKVSFYNAREAPRTYSLEIIEA